MQQQPGWDSSKKQLATEVMEQIRKHFITKGEEHKGPRFTNDEVVYQKLSERYCGSDFDRHPFTCVHWALTESARADHWYAAEKEY